MSNKKKCQVIMLSTEKSTVPKQDLLLCIKSYRKNYFEEVYDEGKQGNIYLGMSHYARPEYYTRQHLYIISDDEIKEGDWFMWKSEIHKFHSDAGYGIKTYTEYNEQNGSSLLVNHSNVRGKIIASTDTSLNLPTISKEFIEIYIEEYNKNKPIVDILCHIEENTQGQQFLIVDKEKELWTKEEVCTDMQYYMEYCQANGYITPMKWLKELKHY